MFYRISTNDIFVWTITIFIIINTIVLSLDKHPIEDGEERAHQIINDILSWAFVLEMIIKLIGLGFRGYA